MKSYFIFSLVLIIILAPVLTAESFYLSPYYQQSDFLNATPGVSGDVAGAMFNPAVWGLNNGLNLQYFWNDLDKSEPGIKNWAFMVGASSLGFAMQHWDFSSMVNNQVVNSSVDDYHLGLGMGDKANSFGIGYSWSQGDLSEDILRDNTFSAGYIGRPCSHMSYGIAGQWALRQEDFRGIVDAGIRPFGSPLLTIFGDATMITGESLEDVLWSAGASVEPVPGVSVFGKYFEDETYTVGLTFSLSDFSFTAMPRYDKNNDLSYTTYGVRLGTPKPDPFTPLAMKDKLYLRMDFTGALKYQRYKLFDQDGYTLMEVLETLDNVKEDDRIAGIVLKITEDMRGSWELIWEVREKIKEVKAAGKTVVVFLERGAMQHYYLASAADKIMVDPETMIPMFGFNLGRTFYKKMLDKIGLGVEEWRYFKYKSAFESFSRESMSDGDREQRKAIIDGWYETLRADVCEGRGISSSDFDHVVNNICILSADSLRAYNLIDTTGRWDEVSDLIEQVEGSKKKMIGEAMYSALQPEYDEWGISPKIAVIYALGPCAMNSGINARRLEGVIQRARDDKHVKAVVFRADSPGGDILPSDIVAEELKKTAEEKPVIVSQGFVAGSGGYWISMYGDKIVASPWTITGSIGVIGGWIYDDGLGDKIGLTYDYTKVGDHADFGGGMVLPLLGAQIPDRALSDWESKMVEKMIRGHYQNFLQKVANGRGMTKEAVHEVAQGRIWTGTAGLKIGLIDEIGGMTRSIELAREAAGIHPKRRVDIVEMPTLGMFDPTMFQPKLFGMQMPAKYDFDSNPDMQYLKMMIDSQGRPLIMMTPDSYVH